MTPTFGGYVIWTAMLAVCYFLAIRAKLLLPFAMIMFWVWFLGIVFLSAFLK